MTSIANGEAGSSVRSKLNVLLAANPNFLATTSPVTTNDNTQGYGPGSWWLNVNTGQLWICRNATTNAAVWLPVQIPADSPGFIVGNWYYGGMPGQRLVTGGAVNNTTQYMYPFLVRERCTIDQLAMRMTTPGTTNIQMALYASDPALINRPGALLSSTGSIVSTGAAGMLSGALAAPVQLDPGIYWYGFQTGDNTILGMGIEATGTGYSSSMGSSTSGGALGNLSAMTIGVTVVSVFGTWATAVGATFTENVSPRSGGAFAFHVNSAP